MDMAIVPSNGSPTASGKSWLSNKNLICRIALVVLGIILLTGAIIIHCKLPLSHLSKQITVGFLSASGAILTTIGLFRLFPRFFFPFKEAPHLPKPRLDPTIRENALIILGIPREHENDLVFINQRYQDLTREWKKRISKTKEAPPLCEKFTQLLETTQEAYCTLTAKA